ncbi:MAG: hypothetical protein ABIT71_26565 [Vicinamibacteraceae bacterium]
MTDPSSIEPRDGDVVVVRASRAPDGTLRPAGEAQYAVITWGLFELVSDRLGSLPQDEAIVEARHCAAERAHDAWDSTGKRMVRLPRLPLVYRGVAGTYAVSVDVTDYSSPRSEVAWKSASYLSEADALNTIVADGVSLPIAKALLGKAPMPMACS